MSRTWKIVVALVAIGLVAGGTLFFNRSRGNPPVVVTLRIAVEPKEQAGFVAEQGNSSRFRYLVGKQAGVNPVLAQKLSIKLQPGSPLLEGQLRLLTREEAEKYTAGFIETLQLVCGTQAKVTLADKTIR
jgi:hypothetical protein